MGIRLAIAVLWLLRLLPLPLLAWLGQRFGDVLHLTARRRRNIGTINLALCFPDQTAAWRARVLRDHFRCYARSVLERGILWWSRQKRFERLVSLVGEENLLEVGQRPVVFLAPHFVGLDMGGVRLGIQHPFISMYSHQKSAMLDRLLHHGRTRFAPLQMVSRQDGIRPVIKALRQGSSLYYLPDMDFGRKDSVFVPFFGQPAATITGLARLCQASGAVVVPCITRQLSGGAGYEARLYPAWEDFPSGDPSADARRMNAFIEQRILEMPEQYFWLHKRFKTRPDGMPPLYR